ncbi:glycogen debranching protein GlgX [Microbacterium nymphoidis]|uniref:glycogen debranching protein GlgX n=1 Tax=Microbacterium nymphoidis TaxID=2898586 RepID=UPI001E2A7130|nr:glycogen debranching protein GlgX [Microbacterium nymphoidis]MCD2497171.1 glycogen debranching protein GlgX [Microbacterium nymphoidis]
MDSSDPTQPPAFLDAALDGLGVRLANGIATIRVHSHDATAVELLVFNDDDLDWVTDTVTLTRGPAGVWSATTDLLHVGSPYMLRASGPAGSRFDSERMLIDPYSRGLIPGDGYEDFRSVVIDETFDWGGVAKPAIPLDETIIYEGHLKGLSKRHPDVPPALHGTYAGLAHPAMIEHFRSLGITAVELLPVHAFSSEPRLLNLGLSNYWGYNTVSFFTPHAAYATADARRAGPAAVLREFKGMVKLLHQAGIEVILDVVYNHTSEEGPGGPTTSLRGLDDATYYRQGDDGSYIDTTGCGNTLNTSAPAAARLVLDSLRYWAQEVGIDGFRFDLATSLGRDAGHEFTPDHPLLQAIRTDPALAGVKIIAEPWDVGMGGWQTGNFGPGWQEWNDRYRDRVRNFWLSDIDYARRAGIAPTGIGGFATRLAGSSNTFSNERGPLASVNFVTAHDGFTMRDLVSYGTKHNLANGEHNRDGADQNRSFNHGAEGPTDDAAIRATRRKAIRNLFGTLLLSAGTPMITAGDETGRTQHGNNNAYCQDSPMTWLSWQHEPWQEELRAHVSALTRIRRENPALRPSRYAVLGEHVEGASEMEWFDENGETMSADRWQNAGHRTLQYFAAENLHDGEPRNKILLMIHGNESPIVVRLPRIPGVTRYRSLWSSEEESPQPERLTYAPGDTVTLTSTAMHLFGVDSDDERVTDEAIDAAAHAVAAADTPAADATDPAVAGQEDAATQQ